MQECPERGPAAVGDLEPPVRAAQARAEHPDVRVRFGQFEELPERVGRDECVVVQEEQEPAAGDGGGLVAGPGEPAVVRVADQHDLRELGRDHVRRAVGRAVVRDHHLKGRALLLIEQRPEAPAEQLGAVPVGNAHGHVRRGGGGNGGRAIAVRRAPEP